MLAFHSCGHAVACLPISSLYAGLPRAGRARGTPPPQLWTIFSMKFGFALGFGVAACSVLRSSRAAAPQPGTHSTKNGKVAGRKARDVFKSGCRDPTGVSLRMKP